MDLRKFLPRPDPSKAPKSWLRRPNDLSGRRVCLFVSYDPGGQIPDTAEGLMRGWADQGFDVIAIVVGQPAPEAISRVLGFCSGVLTRANEGYDFGAWATAIRDLDTELAGVDLLAIANDSVYGPLDSFNALIKRVNQSPSDVIGLTESLEIRPHLQSYCLFFKPRAVRSAAFKTFWRGVRTGGRQDVINRYELPLADSMRSAGLSVEALYPAKDGRNPTLTRWRELIEAGFPFVKAQLLRENPAGADITDWRDVVRAGGLDPVTIDHHLAARLESRA